MKKGQLISFKQTNAATLAVQNELFDVGLWYKDSKLQEVTVYHCSYPVVSIPDADGFFFHGSSLLYRLLGYEIGNIYIPKFVLSRLFNQNRGSLRAVIRHEYGHAFAHYYPELIIDSIKFESVFGGHYFELNSSMVYILTPNSDAFITFDVFFTLSSLIINSVVFTNTSNLAPEKAK